MVRRTEPLSLTTPDTPWAILSAWGADTIVRVCVCVCVCVCACVCARAAPRSQQKGAVTLSFCFCAPPSTWVSEW